MTNIKGLYISGGPSTVTKKNFKKYLKKYLKKNTNIRYMLWFTTNC